MQIYLSRYLFILVLFFYGLGCSTKEQDVGPSLLASVGSNSITVENVQNRFGEQTKDSVFVYHFLSNWVERELLYLGGVSRGIGLDLSVVQKISDYKKDLIGIGFLSLNEKTILVEDNDIRTYYANNRGVYKRKQKEVLVSYFSVPVLSAALKIKRELKKDFKKKNTDVLLKYNGIRRVFRFGDFPGKFNDDVFNKNNFKKGNLLGPYSFDNNYYVIKIEKVFSVGSYIGIDLVYDEIYQRLKNKAKAMRRRIVVDSLWFEYIVKIDSQIIRSLIKQ